MRNKICYIFLLSILLFCHPELVSGSIQIAHAQDVELNSEVNYELRQDGSTKVTQTIDITNTSTESAASEFSITLSSSTPEQVSVTSNKEALDFELKENNINIFLDGTVVGEDATQTINISFLDKSIIGQSGDVTEVTIPKLSSQGIFDKYLVRVISPSSFGPVSYIFPEPVSSLGRNDSSIFYYNKENLADSVKLIFGESQVFSFDISYHLENPLVRGVKQEVAIPHDTSYQTVYYDRIKPTPDEIKEDEEGNWFAIYNMLPRERLDIQLLGYVQIFTEPVRKNAVKQDFLNKHLLPQEYWQTEDENIKQIAERLKTPENIYEFVVETLEYSYQKVSPTSKRSGAVGALRNPNFAICTEFTDLFITLSRAAGIPAREVNGFAYTENEALQPSSLVADVLHAWPEYWDFDTQVWVPVDPTWADTTGGVDYFNKLDLRHFSFVKHGLSSTEPASPGSYKLGENPQKDIFISFAKLPENHTQEAKLNLDLQSTKIKITNSTGRTMYKISIKVESDSGVLLDDKIEKILPYKSIEFDFNKSLNYTAQVGEQQKIYKHEKQKLNINMTDQIIYIIAASVFAVVIVIFISIFVISKSKK